MNPVKALNILLCIKRVFDKNQVPFWLDGGVCLGAVRQNSFLECDFDVDVGFLSEHDHKIPVLVEGLQNEGFNHFHVKEHPCGQGKQISSIKDGIGVDMFIYYPREDKRWRLMFDIEPLRTVRFIPCIYPAYLFEKELKKIDFMDYGVDFYLPHDPEEYLKLQYGDWQKDKPFRWQTDYKSMDMDFEIFPKPKGKRRWILTETIRGFHNSDGSFFIPLIKEGYKVFPLEITKDGYLLDGNKRLDAYKKCSIPMVECYVRD